MSAESRSLTRFLLFIWTVTAGNPWTNIRSNIPTRCKHHWRNSGVIVSNGRADEGPSVPHPLLVLTHQANESPSGWNHLTSSSFNKLLPARDYCHNRLLIIEVWADIFFQYQHCWHKKDIVKWGMCRASSSVVDMSFKLKKQKQNLKQDARRSRYFFSAVVKFPPAMLWVFIVEVSVCVFKEYGRGWI